MPGAIEVFEELRFVWELMGAEVLLLVALSPKKRRVGHLVALGLALFSVASLGYFAWLEAARAALATPPLIAAWYLLLTGAIMERGRRSFHVSLADTLFVGVVAYAAQHVVYVVVHEHLALWLWRDLQSCLPLYALVSALFCVLLYAGLWRLFSPGLMRADGHLLDERPQTAVYMALVLAALLSLTFGFQHLFHLAEANRPFAVWMSVLACIMVMGMQRATLRAIVYSREAAALEQMLRDASAHWNASRDLIENVNRTAHDLKHTLRALDSLPESARAEFVSEASEYIRAYESRFFSDDEVLNTILSEKALACERRHIAFSCAVGAVDLRFFKVPDLCVLLGNVMDNAMEAVEKIEEPQRRAISMQIHERAGLVLISCDNPFVGTLRMAGDLPATSKPDRISHGYGLKSARLIAQKYAGTLSVGAREGVFTVQVAVPARPGNVTP